VIKFNVKGLYEFADVFFVSRKALLSMVGLLVLFMFFVVFYGGRDYGRDFSMSKGNSYIEGLRIVNKKDGTDLWTISAKKAVFSKDGNVAQLSDVTIDMKKEGAVLNADSGKYNMNSRDLSLENNIKIHMKNSVISAKTLSWNAATGVLSSENEVQMQGDKFSIKGEGLSATKDNKVTLKGNVKAIFH
jgi:lipopolysaccharide export system protein LptC